MRLHYFLFYLFLTTLLCCSPQKVDNPQGNNAPLQTQQAPVKPQYPIKPNKAQATIKELNVITLPVFPVQVNAAVVVELKNTCTSINEIYQTRRGDTFLIEMLEYHQKQPQCQPRSTLSEYIIPLDVDNLSAGHYTVYVNQQREHFELMVDN